MNSLHGKALRTLLLLAFLLLVPTFAVVDIKIGDFWRLIVRAQTPPAQRSGEAAEPARSPGRPPAAGERPRLDQKPLLTTAAGAGNIPGATLSLAGGEAAPSRQVGVAERLSPLPRDQVDGQERCSRVQQQLKTLGASYLLLDSWGADLSTYRFCCEMPEVGGATRRFEATDTTAAAAMERVLADVEAWRLDRSAAQRPGALP